MRTLFTTLSDARKALLDAGQVSVTLFKVYSELTWAHDMYMISQDDEFLKDFLQNLSMHWTGQNELDFRELKLLRMKSFGTI
jgi:hypothetical protein